MLTQYKLIKQFSAYKKYYSRLPNNSLGQLKAFYNYTKKFKKMIKPINLNYSLGTLYNFYFNKNIKKNKLVTAYQKFNKIVIFQKNFIIAKKNYFRTLKTLFLYKRVKGRLLTKYIRQFVNKKIKAISSIFILNPIKLIMRVFPFFDRFFIIELIKYGFIYKNYSCVTISTKNIAIGDFIQLSYSTQFKFWYKL
jgi:hypothetical protein